jgi:hypothetical protein
MRIFFGRAHIKVITLVVACTFLCFSHLVGSASSSFYYFNPDSSQSNFSHLKQVMDSVLLHADSPLAFQAFARIGDFDRKVREETPRFIFLPSWHINEGDNAEKYEPFLAPTRQGATTYRKVLLVAAGSNLTMQDLFQETIAMTPMGSAGQEILNKAIFKAHGLDCKQLNFITTAKDSDALFALALHQVNAALVSADNLESIAEINPRIMASVKPLAVSEPIPLPIMCYAKNFVPKAEVEKIKNIFINGKQNSHAVKIMEMLQIDGWRPIEK